MPDEFGSLAWWLRAAETIDSLYQQELLRKPLPDNQALANWLYHAREHGRDAEWMRARFRESEEYKQVHGPIPRVRVDGSRFVTEHGAPWVWKGATDFLLFKRFLEGQDIVPILNERKAVGANLVRVLGMCHYITHFYPQDHANYYEKLSAFFDLLFEHRLYVEFVCFADQQEVKIDEQAHFNRVCDVIRSKSNVFLELVNEWRKNGIDPNEFSKPSGIISSRGSGLGDEAPPTPGWDYHTWHGRRDWPKVLFANEDMWFVKEGIVYPNHHVDVPRPTVADEPIGFGPHDIPGRRSNNPYVAKVTAETGLLFGSGATFHSDEGIQSQGFQPHTTFLAKTFFAGLE